jgi:hypothetical protein
VKDFFKEYWKIAAGCAAGAFLLSFLIGLITRNPFGVVILRAFLLALLFAGVGTGLRYVVRRYLPEAMPSASAAPATAEQERGGRVDITLPEEDGVSRQQVRAEARKSRAGRTADADEETSEQVEAQALGDLAQDLGEELGAAEDGAGPPDAEEQDVSENDAEYEEEAEPVTALSAGQGAEEDLDTLPDISTLETSPEDVDTGSRPARRVNGGERPEDAVKGALSGQDPATLARAIRTVLSKDEKG